MSNPSLQSSTLVILGLAAVSMSEAHARDDWRCDRPAHFYPPIGCALWGDNLDKGLCTSYLATGNWHCLSSWTPMPRGGGYDDHDMMLKSLPALSLPLPVEFALRDPRDSGRSLRLALDSQALGHGVGSSLPVLELQAMDGKRSGVSLQIERDGHGGFELLVRALGESRPLVRLPLAQGRSSVLVDWRIDELNGPQLKLSSGLQSVEVGLPTLDANTRLQLWRSRGLELHFDVGARRPEAGKAGSDEGSGPEMQQR